MRGEAMNDHKKDAVDFLQMVVAGDIEKAYKKYVDMSGKHHNSFCQTGFEGLKKGMIENEDQFPNKKFTVKHVLGDSDLVSVHSHLWWESRASLNWQRFTYCALGAERLLKCGTWRCPSRRIPRIRMGCFKH
jgi:predicted SnoaL-like aldol condensation-catalyzing enzyme